MITDSVARESDGPRLPLSAIGCNNIREERSCQGVTEGNSRLGADERRLQPIERVDRVAVVRAETVPGGVDRVSDPFHERAVIL